MKHRPTWPNGKQFAFTVFDDTDLTTLENGPILYEFLHDLGFLTTKSVWMLRGDGTGRIGGSTCEEPEYLVWVKQLQRQGFEIAYHGATNHTSSREQTRKGLEAFRQTFGEHPRSYANHSDNHENLYWGEARISGPVRLAYNLSTRFRNQNRFTGHVSESPLFWGDLCKEHIKYVRNFVYADINTLNACPQMPYHDPTRPYVNYWFASSEGANVDSFVRTISESNQDRLEQEGGGCVMYTHFANGFVENGKLHPEFKRLMERLSKKSGWFVPVSPFLDYLLEQKSAHQLSALERQGLEWKWLMDKRLVGGTS